MMGMQQRWRGALEKKPAWTEGQLRAWLTRVAAGRSARSPVRSWPPFTHSVDLAIFTSSCGSTFVPSRK
jgi:hypothetical protein